MFDAEKLNDALGKGVTVCVNNLRYDSQQNKSNKFIYIIFNLFCVILSSCLFISIVSLSFENDLNINEVYMKYQIEVWEVVFHKWTRKTETNVYTDSSVSTDDVTILCQLNKIRGNNLNNVIIAL